MNSSTLHIKVTKKLAQGLKNLARKRNVPVGELVRKAVINTYQLEMANLPDYQQKAITAYQAGYITTGKLAEEMGMTVIELRSWISDHGIAQNTAFNRDDMENA